MAPVEFLKMIWLRPVDSRRYALVRMVFAAVTLLHIANLWPYRIALLCNDGMIGQVTGSGSVPGFYISIYALLDTPLAVTASFLIAASATILLGYGKWARPMLAVVFLFLLSVMQHAPISAAGWDFILMNLGFILLFSPLGNQWNHRNLLCKKGTPPDTEFMPQYGLSLIQLQVFVIYWQTVILKINNYFWQTGDFMTYFMVSHHSRFPGSWVINWQGLLDMMTYMTLLVELAIPVLLWIPKTRRIGLVIGIGFHLGIALLGINLGMFSIVMISTFVAFLNPWPRAGKKEVAINPPPQEIRN